MEKMTQQKEVHSRTMVGNMTYVCYRTRGDPLGRKVKAP